MFAVCLLGVRWLLLIVCGLFFRCFGVLCWSCVVSGWLSFGVVYLRCVFVVCCLLLGVRSLLFGVCCLMIVFCCLSIVDSYSVSCMFCVAFCVLFLDCCLLVVDCCSSLFVGCLLLGVCCWRSVDVFLS